MLVCWSKVGSTPYCAYHTGGVDVDMEVPVFRLHNYRPLSSSFVETRNLGLDVSTCVTSNGLVVYGCRIAGDHNNDLAQTNREEVESEMRVKERIKMSDPSKQVRMPWIDASQSW